MLILYLFFLYCSLFNCRALTSLAVRHCCSKDRKEFVAGLPCLSWMITTWTLTSGPGGESPYTEMTAMLAWQRAVPIVTHWPATSVWVLFTSMKKAMETNWWWPQSTLMLETMRLRLPDNASVPRPNFTHSAPCLHRSRERMRWNWAAFKGNETQQYLPPITHSRKEAEAIATSCGVQSFLWSFIVCNHSFKDGSVPEGTEFGFTVFNQQWKMMPWVGALTCHIIFVCEQISKPLIYWSLCSNECVRFGVRYRPGIAASAADDKTFRWWHRLRSCEPLFTTFDFINDSRLCTISIKYSILSWGQN